MFLVTVPFPYCPLPLNVVQTMKPWAVLGRKGMHGCLSQSGAAAGTGVVSFLRYSTLQSPVLLCFARMGVQTHSSCD